MFLARVEMEYGMFPKAEAHLNELGSFLTDNKDALTAKDKVHHYHTQCKYYHILSKVLVRSNYLQKALEFLDENIELLEKPH